MAYLPGLWYYLPKYEKRRSDMETIVIDHQFQEVLSFSDAGFPIQYYVDNLNQWAEYQVPLHWHCGYEIFTALHQDIEVQAGQEHLILQKGESIFIRGGQLHSYRMTEPGRICLCPNIVFTEEVLAPAAGTVFKKYFSPVLNNPALPYIILRGNKLWQTTLTEHLFKIYALLAANVPENHSDCGAIKPLQSDCPEIEVHQNLVSIFKILYSHQQELPHTQPGRPDQHSQIRLQKMLRYIQAHFLEEISLDRLAASAGIGRSEAGRCFKKYYARSPMSYVTLYRIKYAQELLVKTSLSVSEIAVRCGFKDSSYFIKVFRKYLSRTPSEYRNEYVQLC